MNISSLIYRFKERLQIFSSYWKVTKNMYDFDFSSILYVELHQMKRVRKAIEKYRSHVYWERDVARIKLAEKILTMFMENDWWSLDYDLEHNHAYIIPYVNTKNTKRFFPKYTGDVNRDFFKRDLYEEKLWNLYYLIRKNYTRTWWD